MLAIAAVLLKTYLAFFFLFHPHLALCRRQGHDTRGHSLPEVPTHPSFACYTLLSCIFPCPRTLTLVRARSFVVIIRCLITGDHFVNALNYDECG